MNTSLFRLTTLTAAAILLGASTGVLAQADDHAAHHPEQTDTGMAAEQAPGMGGPGMMGGMQGMRGMMDRRMMRDMPGMMDPEMMQGMMGMRGRGMMPGMMMGRGMMHGMMGHGMGPMGGMGMLHGLGPIGMLELDEAQRNEIRRMHSELRREHWETLGRLLDERETLQELYAAEPRDPAAIGEAHQRLFDLKRPLIEAMVDAGNRIEALLSEEQREQLKQLRRHGRGPMGGMGMMGR